MFFVVARDGTEGVVAEETFFHFSATEVFQGEVDEEEFGCVSEWWRRFMEYLRGKSFDFGRGGSGGHESSLFIVKVFSMFCCITVADFKLLYLLK